MTAVTRRDFLKALGTSFVLLRSLGARPSRWFPGTVPSGISPLEGRAQALFEQVPPSISGIFWKHVNGRSPSYYLPETTGAGCAFLDYDNDGWMDIYLVNSGRCDFYEPNPPLRNALYRNNRDGTFTDVTEKAGVSAVATEWALRSATTTETVIQTYFSVNMAEASFITTMATVRLPMSRRKPGLPCTAGHPAPYGSTLTTMESLTSSCADSWTLINPRISYAATGSRVNEFTASLACTIPREAGFFITTATALSLTSPRNPALLRF